MIETARLKLLPATVALARAEIGDRGAFARLLEAPVPDNWPPETLADALPLFLGWLEAAPDRVGWFGWYALATGEGAAAPILVASGGFKGPPQDGTAKVGYSVLPQFQGRGYATEMIGGLVRWALGQPGVARVVAETEWANPASVRVLSKVGFVPAGSATEPGGARFEFPGGARQDTVRLTRAEQEAARDGGRITV
jgi:RimJ/RimL family protein N-acetyltransferase